VTKSQVNWSKLRDAPRRRAPNNTVLSAACWIGSTQDITCTTYMTRHQLQDNSFLRACRNSPSRGMMRNVIDAHEKKSVRNYIQLYSGWLLEYSTYTACIRTDEYDQNHPSAELSNYIVVLNVVAVCCMWSTVSKAADRSNSVKTATSPSSTVSRMSDNNHMVVASKNCWSDRRQFYCMGTFDIGR